MKRMQGMARLGMEMAAAALLVMAGCDDGTVAKGDADADTGAELMEVNIMDYSNSPPLVEGPDLNLNSGYNGWSGLAGPLTECMTTIPM